MGKRSLITIGLLTLPIFASCTETNRNTLTDRQINNAFSQDTRYAIHAFEAGLIVKKCPEIYRVPRALMGEQRLYNSKVASVRARNSLKSFNDLESSILSTPCKNMSSLIAQSSGVSRYLEAVK